MNQEKELSVPDGSRLLLKQMFSGKSIKCISHGITSFLHAGAFSLF